MAILYTKRPVIYISGPLSADGNWLTNIHWAGQVAATLIEEGFAPITPHLLALGQLINPATDDHDYETWMSIDCSIIDVCDAVLRMPGESKGGDIETDHAISKHIPVFIEIEAMVKHFGL
jgi:hypothetical protein